MPSDLRRCLRQRWHNPTGPWDRRAQGRRPTYHIDKRFDFIPLVTDYCFAQYVLQSADGARHCEQHARLSTPSDRGVKMNRGHDKARHQQAAESANARKRDLPARVNGYKKKIAFRASK